MEWTIDYLEQDGIVCVNTTGSSDWEQNTRMCEETLAAGRERGLHRFLVDERGITSPLTMLQLDSLPKTLKKMGATTKDRIAVVFSPNTNMANMFKFFANTAILESLNVKLFTDINEAIAWLKSET